MNLSPNDNSTSNTLYGHVTEQVLAKAKKIKLFICDIDGVFSDGRIYLGNQGEELKAFHTKDGYGVKALGNSGVDVAVITGRRSNIVLHRMQSLNVKHIVQGEENKLPALKKMAQQLELAVDEIAYIGDDMPDYECMNYVGLSIAVQDAHPQVRQCAHYVTFTRGGFGAVREVCDLIMQCQGTLSAATGASV